VSRPAKPTGPLYITAPDPDTGEVYTSLPISERQLQTVRRQVRRRKMLRMPIVRRFVAPMSRPREASPAGRRRATATSRGGDSGDGEPPGSDLARPDGRASRRALPELVIRLPLEGRLTARFDRGSGDDERFMVWLASSRELLRAARVLVDLHQSITEVDEEAGR
jgi:hypothetical protein